MWIEQFSKFNKELKTAIRDVDQEIFDQLEDHQLRMKNALVQASSKGETEVVKVLIDLGADGRNPALVFSVRHGHEEITRLLLRAGANPRLALYANRACKYPKVIEMVKSWQATNAERTSRRMSKGKKYHSSIAQTGD